MRRNRRPRSARRRRNSYELPYPMTNPAYPAMLAHDWNKKGQPDPTGWWASEKYDGLRALWDGENFYSRNGKIFAAPQWYKDTLPSTPLDGELWMERSVAGFQKAVSAVRKKVGGKEWADITYMVFDIPTSTEPFEKVQAKLTRMDLGPYAEVAPQHRVKGEADMLKRFKSAVAEGAEGIMLRKPGSAYAPRRSASLLKVKPTDSAEAVVTGYQGGTGKHAGRMGAVHVHLASDPSKQFKIGTGFSDREREDPPPIGSIVEFQYNDVTAAGIPRFPAFLRVRTDLMPRKKAPKPKAASKYSIVGRPFVMVHDRGMGIVDTRVGVVVAGKPPIAFYQSTGTGTPGMVESGEWVPFGGVIPGWIIKAKAAKVPPGKMKEISRWLSSKRIGEPARRFDVNDWEKINAFLKSRNALCKLDSAVFSCKLPPEAKAPKPKAKAKPAPRAKAKPAPSRAAQDYFGMSTPELMALRDAGSRTELTRRGRDPATGKKRR